MYVSYEEYMAYGGTVGIIDFRRFEAKARRLIDRMTHGRCADEKPVRESVRMCMFELIGAMAANEAEAGYGGRELAAMSNDGVSVTYAGNAGGFEKRLTDIVRMWLDSETTEDGVNLMYAGVN